MEVGKDPDKKPAPIVPKPAGRVVASSKDASGKVNPQEKRILVIDDDDHLLKMLQITLEMEGFQVKTERDGRRILELALEYMPNLIVSDLMMPGGGGYEVLHTLQTDPVTRKIPIIIMTGYNKDKSTADILKQEPNVIDFLTKPLDMQTFRQLIHVTLHTKSKDEQIMEQQKRFGEPDFDKITGF